VGRDLFLGTYGSTVSALLILLLLLLTVSMSLRLLLTRRKRAYMSLTVSLLLFAIQYIAVIFIGSRPDVNDSGTALHLLQGLQALSFIVLNVGIYQLYNPSKRKVTILSYLGAIMVLLIIGAKYYAATQLFDNPAAADAVAQTNAFLNIWMDIYVYLLIFICFYFITPAIGQTMKYQLALVIVFLTHSSAVLNSYVFDRQSVWLTAAEYYVPVLFFFIIFLFIFERVLELMQAVYHSSITDGLTGLYNRRFFMRRVQQYADMNVPHGVVFADIDNFKRLNDTRGHQYGDETLRRVAAVALEIAEEHGLAGRFGGEEIVLLVEGKPEQIAKAAEQLRERVETETGVTVSVGWAAHRKGVDAEQLTKQADEAMYASKKGGKNRVTGYTKGLPKSDVATKVDRR